MDNHKITPETLAACSALLNMQPDRLLAAVTESRQPVEKNRVFVTPGEAAKRLGFCRATIVRQLQAGTIPGRKFGHSWRVDLAALMQDSANTKDTQ